MKHLKETGCWRCFYTGAFWRCAEGPDWLSTRASALRTTLLRKGTLPSRKDLAAVPTTADRAGGHWASCIASVDSPGLKEYLKQITTIGIYFKVSLPAAGGRLQEVRAPEAVARICPACVIISSVSSQTQTEFAAEIWKCPAHKEQEGRAQEESATDCVTVNPVSAFVPAGCQPRAITPHSADQEGWKEDSHLKLPPQCEYVSVLYHSLLTKRYNTAVLTAVAGTVLSDRVDHSWGSKDAALCRQKADKRTVANSQVPCHLVESTDLGNTPGLFIKCIVRHRAQAHMP